MNAVCLGENNCISCSVHKFTWHEKKEIKKDRKKKDGDTNSSYGCVLSLRLTRELLYI